MENPYAPNPTAASETRPSVLKTMLQRSAAVILYVAGWVAVGVISRTASIGAVGEISVRAPESALTTLQSLARFCEHYWFTAFVFLSPPVCLAIWALLKRNGIQRTRWALLGIGLAISPILIVVAWLLFRPLLFPPTALTT